ncbi:hypothetical protein BV25DRAFT_1834756 [Artomyces pyxidatus]|uniref:Uncharacterized protein n=1 Tax=Artomyces pyxidatus TaxID=48021 RepID=A0ACB8TGZ2_9AGAM|nr:hypothetical protein BV25DRAFT_1834756 [Artomyces pyxidatus]
MADRHELMRNAVAFLTDPKAQSSSLAQRIQFLEAKGLTGPEIEEAMRHAAEASRSLPSASAYQPAYGPVYGPTPYMQVPPTSHQWDWRDYFITAVISGSVAYGAAALARKYLIPHLKPPTSTAYEADRDAMTAQFDAAEALLKEIQAETAAVKAAVEVQQEKVEKATTDVEAAVQQMREGETKTRDEMREIREEVTNIREMLPKMIDKNKETQIQSLAELQQELKSLKALLLSRGPAISNTPTVTPPPVPSIPLRPAIPAWQLSGSISSSTTGVPVSSPSAPLASSPMGSPFSNGKAKEVELQEVDRTPCCLTQSAPLSFETLVADACQNTWSREPPFERVAKLATSLLGVTPPTCFDAIVTALLSRALLMAQHSHPVPRRPILIALLGLWIQFLHWAVFLFPHLLFVAMLSSPLWYTPPSAIPESDQHEFFPQEFDQAYGFHHQANLDSQRHGTCLSVICRTLVFLLSLPAATMLENTICWPIRNYMVRDLQFWFEVHYVEAALCNGEWPEVMEPINAAMRSCPYLPRDLVFDLVGPDKRSQGNGTPRSTVERFQRRLVTPLELGQETSARLNRPTPSMRTLEKLCPGPRRGFLAPPLSPMNHTHTNSSRIADHPYARSYPARPILPRSLNFLRRSDAKPEVVDCILAHYPMMSQTPFDAPSSTENLPHAGSIEHAFNPVNGPAMADPSASWSQWENWTSSRSYPRFSYADVELASVYRASPPVQPSYSTDFRFGCSPVPVSSPSFANYGRAGLYQGTATSLAPYTGYDITNSSQATGGQPSYTAYDSSLSPASFTPYNGFNSFTAPYRPSPSAYYQPGYHQAEANPNLVYVDHEEPMDIEITGNSSPIYEASPVSQPSFNNSHASPPIGLVPQNIAVPNQVAMERKAPMGTTHVEGGLPVDNAHMDGERSIDTEAAGPSRPRGASYPYPSLTRGNRPSSFVSTDQLAGPSNPRNTTSGGRYSTERHERRPQTPLEQPPGTQAEEDASEYDDEEYLRRVAQRVAELEAEDDGEDDIAPAENHPSHSVPSTTSHTIGGITYNFVSPAEWSTQPNYYTPTEPNSPTGTVPNSPTLATQSLPLDSHALADAITRARHRRNARAGPSSAQSHSTCVPANFCPRFIRFCRCLSAKPYSTLRDAERVLRFARAYAQLSALPSQFYLNQAWVRRTPRMFSQFRNVVEGFAPPRRPSQDASGHDRNESTSRSSSLDNTASGDSTSNFNPITDNLRKSLAIQRSASPQNTSENGSALVDRPSKRRLEDRLRASFAVGDASSPTTPSTSSRASPAPVPVVEHPLSPTAIPLPTSPPVDIPGTPIPDLSHPLSQSPPPLSLTSHTRRPSDTISNSGDSEERHNEADIPLPLSPVSDNGHLASQASFEQLVAEPTTATSFPRLEEEIALPPSAPEASEGSRDHSETATKAESVEASLVPSDQAEAHMLPLIINSQGDTSEQSAATDAAPHSGVEDISASFKKLQSEKMEADKLLQEFTPVQSIQDTQGLRDHFESMQLKAEISQDEIRRLTGKLTRQDERIEELRETHHLESRSQSDLIEQLRKQLEESEALISAGVGSSTKLEAEVARHKADVDKAYAEAERAKVTAKDEEEKRTKAVSLLKTVRQKLVKAEKERDDAVKEVGAVKEKAAKEVAAAKEKEKAEREKEKAERDGLQSELDKSRSEKEAVVATLRIQFENDVAALKERSERELSTLKSQAELDAITSKALYDRTLATKDTRINSLENSVKALSTEKDSLFDQLQLRQAEVESSQSLLEVLQSQHTELQYQIRESHDRLALLTEELAEARQEQQSKARGPSTTAEDVARLLSNAESRYEVKLSELRRQLTAAEEERTEMEAYWSRRLEEKEREAEKWKRTVESTVQTQQNSDGEVNELKLHVDKLNHEVRSHHQEVTQLQLQIEHLTELEVFLHLLRPCPTCRLTMDNTKDVAKLQRTDFTTKIAALEQQLEEAKTRESQARAHNKTLRDELRKVQSSAALLERQRNPGVGYWSTPRPDGGPDTQTPASPASSMPSLSSPRSNSPAPPNSDEDVNLEYLRNVILQFLEHKEMRPNLVRVLSIILHFTPQETRRLIAKV